MVLDPLGGNDWRKGLKLLRPCGRLVAFGFANLASGQRRRPAHVLSQAAGIPLLTPLQLMNHNRTVSGVNIGRLWGEIAILREEFRAVLALWDAGSIKPHIDAVYPFTEVAAPTAGSCSGRTSARSCSRPEAPRHIRQRKTLNAADADVRRAVNASPAPDGGRRRTRSGRRPSRARPGGTVPLRPRRPGRARRPPAGSSGTRTGRPAGGVAAQVGCQDPVAAPGERGRHPVPAVAVLREAVQQDGDAFRPVPAGRGGVGDLKAERRVGKRSTPPSSSPGGAASGARTWVQQRRTVPCPARPAVTGFAKVAADPATPRPWRTRLTRPAWVSPARSDSLQDREVACGSVWSSRRPN